MDVFKLSVGMTGLALLVSHILPFVRGLKAMLKLERLKPLDCELCLSLWFPIIYILLMRPSIEDSIFLLGYTPIQTYLTWEVITKKF